MKFLERYYVRHGLRYFTNTVIAHIPVNLIRRYWYRQFVSLGQDANIMMGLTLRELRNISIGDRTNINPRCLIDSRGGQVIIGNDCDISPEVNIWTLQHDMNDPNFKSAGGSVIINNFTWIGNRAIILPGVTLGEGCVVAAGAVVTKNVDAYKVMGGVPAKVIGERSMSQNKRKAYKSFLL